MHEHFLRSFVSLEESPERVQILKTLERHSHEKVGTNHELIVRIYFEEEQWLDHILFSYTIMYLSYDCNVCPVFVFAKPGESCTREMVGPS